MGDRAIARPLSAQDSKTQTQKHIHTSSGIRTHELSVRSAEDRMLFDSAATGTGLIILFKDFCI